eukprot:Amastigsp_a5300_13.p4 type:complete len:116 gc:universal Amastigsp_a5300_13:967-620(-)
MIKCGASRAYDALQPRNKAPRPSTRTSLTAQSMGPEKSRCPAGPARSDMTLVLIMSAGAQTVVATRPAMSEPMMCSRGPSLRIPCSLSKYFEWSYDASCPAVSSAARTIVGPTPA